MISIGGQLTTNDMDLLREIFVERGVQIGKMFFASTGNNKKPGGLIEKKQRKKKMGAK